MEQSIASTPDAAKLKRKKEIDKILNKYISDWRAKPLAIQITVDQYASDKITEAYFGIINETIKGQYLSPISFANKYKVAAGTELACMLVLPISIVDKEYSLENRRHINAHFAVTAAIQMILAIHYDSIGKLEFEKATKETLLPAMATHVTWLKYLNLNNPFALPTFLNSNFWELFLIAST